MGHHIIQIKRNGINVFKYCAGKQDFKDKNREDKCHAAKDALVLNVSSRGGIEFFGFLFQLFTQCLVFHYS